MARRVTDPVTKLTYQQEQFCQRYVVHFNGTQAAIEAKYAPKSAAQQANDLLSRPHVQARVKALSQCAAKRNNIDADYVRQGLIQVAERCLHQREPEMVWNRETKKMEPRTDDDGNIVYRFDSQGANRAFELLGRDFGMFDKRGNATDNGNLDKLIESIGASRKPKSGGNDD